MSQLLLRIEQELGSSIDDAEKSRLLSRKAGYLARVGRFDEARQIVAELREEFGGGQSGRATLWVMLAEGLLHHFEKMSPQAIDRLNRALVLGRAMKVSEVVALASAWKAHIEFETSRFDSMFQSLRTALDNSTDADHETRTRIFMVLCDAALLCGDRQRGQKWFLRTRDHALRDGDQASIEALLYNRAAFNLAWLRAQRCFGPVSAEELGLVRMEISSARNLQDLTGIGALTHYVHICDARLLILEGKFDEAVLRLNALRGATPYGSYNFDQEFFDLEVAFCKYSIGTCRNPLSSMQSPPTLLFIWISMNNLWPPGWCVKFLRLIGHRRAILMLVRSLMILPNLFVH
jgi:hypothetical protein